LLRTGGCFGKLLTNNLAVLTWQVYFVLPCIQ
jgi:hypothetical protein